MSVNKYYLIYLLSANLPEDHQWKGTKMFKINQSISYSFILFKMLYNVNIILYDVNVLFSEIIFKRYFCLNISNFYNIIYGLLQGFLRINPCVFNFLYSSEFLALELQIKIWTIFESSPRSL